MATFGPAARDGFAPAPTRALNFPLARLAIQQRAFGTLAHELGNLSSPVALVADVVEAGRPAQAAASAGTLRLVATSLAQATTLCRLLRGHVDSGALSPATIPDTTAWWSLCGPLATDILPDRATVTASVVATALATHQTEALLWATVAIIRWIGVSRPTMNELIISSDISHRRSFVLRVGTNAPRVTAGDATTRQLRALASWEMRRVGGRLVVSGTDETVHCRLTMPARTDGPIRIA